MKYILGFIALLAIVFGIYSLIGSSAVPQEIKDTQKEARAQVQNTIKTAPKVVQKEATPATKAPTPKATTITKENTNTMTDAKNITKATLKTNLGNVTLELYTEDAPKTVANFVKLASEGFYDGVKFHRVIKGFMIQSGDPLSKVEGAAWGTGGPGYSFEDEIHANNKNDIGTIAMANSGPNTNGSQFFINTANNNFLDTKHTVFGKVVAGAETVDAIENTPTAPGDRPLEAMVIEGIVLE